VKIQVIVLAVCESVSSLIEYKKYILPSLPDRDKRKKLNVLQLSLGSIVQQILAGADGSFVSIRSLFLFF
jgi:hypothetical protein